MRLLVIDPFHGAAGDMILGALLHLGVPKEPVFRAMASVVGMPGLETVVKCGIEAFQIDTKAGPSHRSLSDVLAIVASADAPQEVKIKAEMVFKRLAEAEAEVHGKKTHFHEVGADDAIADVLGSCMAFHLLGADRIEVLPIATGYGMVTMAHGLYPVPAPAVVNLLKNSGMNTLPGSSEGELLTPTGAALLREFSDASVISPSGGEILGVGYGAGRRDDPNSPNVVRMVLYESPFPGGDIVEILETNVDDVSGELIGHFLTRIMEEGARDATATPIMMKKGRPGHLIRVISRPEKSSHLSLLMADELGTLGIRCIPSVHRFIADRGIRKIPVNIKGETLLIPVKFGYHSGKCFQVKPEYEVASDISRRLGIPVRDILRIAERAARDCMETGEGEI